jgi:hypothetical protein
VRGSVGLGALHVLELASGQQLPRRAVVVVWNSRALLADDQRAAGGDLFSPSSNVHAVNIASSGWTSVPSRRPSYQWNLTGAPSRSGVVPRDARPRGYVSVFSSPASP